MNAPLRSKEPLVPRTEWGVGRRSDCCQLWKCSAKRRASSRNQRPAFHSPRTLTVGENPHTSLTLPTVFPYLSKGKIPKPAWGELMYAKEVSSVLFCFKSLFSHSSLLPPCGWNSNHILKPININNLGTRGLFQHCCVCFFFVCVFFLKKMKRNQASK